MFAGESDQTCPNGWQAASDSSVRGKLACLRGFQQASTWSDALATCRENWGHLLVLDASLLQDQSPTVTRTAAAIAQDLGRLFF